MPSLPALARALSVAALVWSCAGPGQAAQQVSPTLHLAPAPHSGPRVALTLDACTGHADERILSALIANNIKVTVFVTARWLRRNPVALARMRARPDLFDLEDHGANHLAALMSTGTIFGVRKAGSVEALRAEIRNGADAIASVTGHQPRWYRGAAAIYDTKALAVIADSGLQLAGFSLSGDGGALFSARRAATAIASAKDGDVIIAHINQPRRAAGQGVAEGILALKKKGFAFVWLDATEPAAAANRVAGH